MPDFSAMSDEALIELVSKGIGPSNTGAASMEMQRRLLVAIHQFNQQSNQQTDGLIALANASGRQSDTMIRLTQWIIALTVILGFLAALQLWAMLVGV